jgi:hypothetical protein
MGSSVAGIMTARWRARNRALLAMRSAMASLAKKERALPPAPASS